MLPFSGEQGIENAHCPDWDSVRSQSILKEHFFCFLFLIVYVFYAATNDYCSSSPSS
jgi:hypothetical protein